MDIDDPPLIVSISNDLLECSVCLERLDTSSKVLPCQHTFCRSCLEDIVSSHEELRCPECRVLVSMKIDDLPPNVLLMRLLSGLRNSSSMNSEINGIQKDTGEAVRRAPIADRKSDSADTAQPIPIQAQPAPQVLPQPTTPPVNVCHAKALFDFQSNVTGDLSFKKGDVLLLRRRIDQNWFYGHLHDREGAFPVNHVQIIVPLPVPQCRAVFDFQMSPTDSEGCLSFTKGQIINVLRRIDANWAEGRIGDGSIGIFPINFVELNTLAKQLIGGEGPPSHLPQSPLPQNAGALAQNNGRSPPGAVQNPSLATKNIPSHRLPLPPPMPTKAANAPSTDSLAHSSNKNTNHYAATVRRELIQPRVEPTQRHSTEFLNRPTATGPSSYAEQTIRTNQSLFPSAESQPRLQPYVAVFAYTPAKPDELELIKGAHYFVSQRCQDGWLRGMNSAKKAGVFPGNHVVPVKDLPPSAKTQQQQQVVSPRPSTIPPVLPSRNQTSVVGPPSSGDEPAVPSSTATITHRSGVQQQQNGGAQQPRLLQAIHGRSGSCPSQLLDLSKMSVSANKQLSQNSVVQPVVMQPQAPQNVFGSQRIRGQKERPALHNLHRQLGERKEDLTTLVGSRHKKSNSLDAGRLLGSSGASNADQNGGGGTKSTTVQVREKFRCIVPYPPNSEYELGLNVGDIVLVNKKRENGWYRGVHQRSGRSGLFPASFVEPAI